LGGVEKKNLPDVNDLKREKSTSSSEISNCCIQLTQKQPRGTFFGKKEWATYTMIENSGGKGSSPWFLMANDQSRVMVQTGWTKGKGFRCSTRLKAPTWQDGKWVAERKRNEQEGVPPHQQ